MKPKIYVETSVLSYLAAPPSKDPVTAGRQVVTGRWWRSAQARYTLMGSEVVREECERGDAKLAERRRELLADVQLFPIRAKMVEVARFLVVPAALPELAAVDALHIAAAAVEQCEYLLTWNFRHIANARIRREVESILARHGYSKTTICTPEELV
jgi:predicted nucleic acid-binding protein